MPTNASEGTNQFRCNACGRYFNTEAELSEHETECRAAKMSTAESRRELTEQDSEPHQPNDAESKEHPFQHGRRQANS
jgi:tRNA(Ile2) C34 agmatinyltransferase TiaS